MRPLRFLGFSYLLLLTFAVVSANAQEKQNENFILEWGKQVVNALAYVISSIQSSLQDLRQWVWITLVSRAPANGPLNTIVYLPTNPRNDEEMLQLLKIPNTLVLYRHPRKVAMVRYVLPPSDMQTYNLFLELQIANRQVCEVDLPWKNEDTTNSEAGTLFLHYNGWSFLFLVVCAVAIYFENKGVQNRLETATLQLQTFIRRQKDLNLVSRKRIQNLTRSQRTLELKTPFQKGMKEIKVPDDGNCLYYAVSYSWYGTIDRHADIRSWVADWLAVNSDLEVVEGVPLHCTESMPWEAFVASQRKDKVYGTDACLYAIAAIFHCFVLVVVDLPSSDLTIAQFNETGKMIILAFSNTHYNPLEYDPNKTILRVPAMLPEDMWECTTCTRWNDRIETNCHRCGRKQE